MVFYGRCMTRIVAKKLISASRDVVFDSVSNFAEMPNTIPDIVGVEFLTKQHSGVGTRFRETRRMGKREMVTELEVTEMEAPERIRIVTDSHGTVWDTVFSLEERGADCELCIDMDARPHALLQRFLTPLMKPLFRRGIKKHLSFLKRHCEAGS